MRGEAVGQPGVRPASPRTARETVAAIVDQRVRAVFRACAYCGRPSARGVACNAHEDLPELERTIFRDVCSELRRSA